MPKRLIVSGLVTCLALAGLSTTWAQPKPDDPGRSLGIASMPNLRDVGGYKTRDGMIVRKGLLYRSGALGRLTQGDFGKIAALGLKCDFDLRLDNERANLPDRVPPGVTIVALDVLADSQNTDPGKLGQLLSTPLQANAEFGGGKAEAVYVRMYRDFVNLPSARKSYRQLFLDLADEAKLPAIIHCSSGKDRTGWAVAALLTLLGVPEDIVVADFVRSNDYVMPQYQRAIERFEKDGGDPAIIRAALGVNPKSLRAAFDEVKSQFGSIEGYFAKALDIDAAKQKALRDRFLVPLGK